MSHSTSLRGDVARTRSSMILTAAISMRALSFFGDLLAATAITLLLQERGESAYLVVVGLVAAAVPPIVLAPLSGRLSDRAHPKVLIVAVASVQVVVLLVMASSSQIPVLIGGILVVASGLALVNPLYSSLPRKLAQPGQVARTSAASQTSVQVAMLAAPAAGGVLFAIGGITLALCATACCSLIVGLIALFLRLGPAITGPPSTGPSMTESARAYSVLRDHVLLTVLAAAGAVVLFVSANSVAAVFLIRETLGGDARQFGVVETMWVVGVVAGGLLVTRIARRNVGTALVTAFALMGVALFGEGLAPSIWVVIALNVVGGLGNGGMASSLHIFINTRVDEAHVGRAFAALGAVSNAAPFGGFLLGGVLLQVLDPRGTYIVIGAAALLVTVCASVILRRTGPARAGSSNA